MIRYILVQNRQGKTRLSKWYISLEEEEKTKLKAEIHRLVASREGKGQSNFVEYRNHKSTAATLTDSCLPPLRRSLLLLLRRHERQRAGLSRIYPSLC